MEGRRRTHLDYRLNYHLTLTCYSRWSRLSPLKLPPQLLALCGLGSSPPSQSPPFLAWYTAGLRLWGDRHRRRRRRRRRPPLRRCRRRRYRSLLRFPQITHGRYRPNISISEHTLNARPVISAVISCHHCSSWSGRAECCTARLDALDLVEDADLLRGTVAGSLCALGARSRWNIRIRDGVESGHLERGKR